MVIDFSMGVTLCESVMQGNADIHFHAYYILGLILYNGQMTDGSGDFMSLGMREGRVEFRFDVGSGPAIIRSDPVSLNEWHTIRIQRDRKDGIKMVYSCNLWFNHVHVLYVHDSFTSVQC